MSLPCACHTYVCGHLGLRTSFVLHVMFIHPYTLSRGGSTGTRKGFVCGTSGVMAWHTCANRTHAAWAMHVQASDRKRTRPQKRTHGQSPCLRSSSRHWQTALWLEPAVSPVELFFSLPPFVSSSSTHLSQLISQIVQKSPKSLFRAEHSEVYNPRD